MRSLAQPCTVNNTFFSLWEGQKWGFFPKDRTYRAFLHNKFFSDTPKGFALLLGQCAALRSLTQLTTPFLASGNAKNGVFSLRIAAFPEAKKGVVNCARLRKAAHWPNNNANPLGLSEKKVYCVESLQFCR